MTLVLQESRAFIHLQLLILRRRFFNPDTDKKTSHLGKIGVRKKFRRLANAAKVRRALTNNNVTDNYDMIMEVGVLIR